MKNIEKNGGKKGVDINHTNVLTSSDSITYGEGLNNITNSYVDFTDKFFEKREGVVSVLREYKEIEKSDKSTNKQKSRARFKINKIVDNNLGKKKYNSKKNKFIERQKSLINKSIDAFIANEKPSEIIKEDLTFRTKKKKNKEKKYKKRKLNKKTTHKLSSWCNGFINERIEFKASVNNISTGDVNAALTSQTCSSCNYYVAKRGNGDVFYCPNCGKVIKEHSNSAINVLLRDDDPEITLKMSNIMVAKILSKRNKKPLGENDGDRKPKKKPIKVITGPTQTQEPQKVNLRADYLNFYNFL